MAWGGGADQFLATDGEWGWGKSPRCMPEARALILGDGEGGNSSKNTLHVDGWAADEARQRSTGGAVEGGVCRAGEEQCAGVKLVNVESGPDGGWSKLSAMGRLWRGKRMASVGFGPSSWRSGSTRGCSFARRRFLAARRRLGGSRRQLTGDSGAECGSRPSASRGSTWGRSAEAASLGALQLRSSPLAHGAARRRRARLTTQRTAGRRGSWR
jgi:hypothetical protein